MRLSRLFLVIFLVTVSFTSFNQKNQLRINGVWKVLSVQMVKADGSVQTTFPQQSQVIFARTYYSFCWTSHDFTAISWAMADSVKLARMDKTIINTGTYDLKGTLLTTRANLALNPMFTNGTATFACSLAKDTLVLTGLTVVSANNIPNPVYAGGAHFVTRLVKLGEVE